jgi:hypothetical protein
MEYRSGRLIIIRATIELRGSDFFADPRLSLPGPAEAWQNRRKLSNQNLTKGIALTCQGNLFQRPIVYGDFPILCEIADRSSHPAFSVVKTP